MSPVFSEYLVFVDESGDHGLDSIDAAFPIFALAFCIIRKEDYINVLTPMLQKFKMTHFGHESVVLHEREIRKDSGAFSFLKTKELKSAFLGELTEILSAAPFTLVCSVIRKDKLSAKYSMPDNPYHIALAFGLERVFSFLRDKGAIKSRTHVMVEMRGKREDADLELEFRRVCDGGNYNSKQLPFEIAFVDKKSNTAGLQIADLVARPIALSILRPDQPNRAMEVIRPKLYTNKDGKLMGWGLKCFP